MSFGSKNACSWGEEGDICPAYRTLWERPPTRDTELIGCTAHAPAALPAVCTVFHPWVDMIPTRLLCHLIQSPKLHCEQHTVRQPKSQCGQA